MSVLINSLKKRRSFYALSNKSVIEDKKIIKIVEDCLKHTPSAFNVQSAKVVLLFGKEHIKLWDITLEELKKIVKPENFSKTENKINTSFKAGYGTVLFFEDKQLTEKLQKDYPSYKDNFPKWAEQANGMLQFAIWTALCNEGLGASLQHYNPIIDQPVRESWKLPENYILIAQMPFGNPLDKPGKKEFEPIKNRLIVAK